MLTQMHHSAVVDRHTSVLRASRLHVTVCVSLLRG